MLISGCVAPVVENTLPSTNPTTITTQPTAPTEGSTIPPTTPPTTIPSPVEAPMFEFEWQVFEYIRFNNLSDLQTERAKLDKYLLDFMLASTDYMNQLPLGDFSPETMAGWDYYSIVLLGEQSRLQELANAYTWDHRFLEYPVATEVWLYMKNEFGWSDIVCAGIMGNLMAECGGCWTDDLDWQIDKASGLGMVQWIGSRREELIEKYGRTPSIEQQLEFMRDELYGTNGVTKQVTDAQLEAIMNAATPQDCAFAFASYYERCAEQHRAPRREYAARA